MIYIRKILHSLSMIVVMAGTGFAAHAEGYRVETFVPGSVFHGVHGLAISPAGELFAGSVIGQTLYRVDETSGDVSVEIAAPQGMADDISFAPDDTMAWTGYITGHIYARSPGGEVRQLAEGLPGINSLAYRSDGRLYATQVFLADALYEIDPKGEAAPRQIIADMGGLNGFEFGPDDKLYGPLWFKGQVVRVDVGSGDKTIVAQGFVMPEGMDMAPDGRLIVAEVGKARIVSVDPADGSIAVLADGLPIGAPAAAGTPPTSLPTGIAVSRDGSIFVTSDIENAILKLIPN